MNYEESMLDPCLYLLRSRESREKIYKNDKKKNLTKCPYVDSEWLMETALGEKGDLFAPVQGLLLIEVDDLCSAGTDLHQKRMKELRKKYKMGRWTTTKQAGGGVFAGRRIEQTANMGFKIDMKDYILEKLNPVKIDKIRRKNVEAPLTDKEKSLLKAVIGSLQWVQRQCRLTSPAPHLCCQEGRQ